MIMDLQPCPLSGKNAPAMSQKIILTTDLAPCLATLSDTQAGQLFRAVFDYYAGVPVSPECPVVAAMVTVFKSHFEREAEKRNDISEKRKQSGSKGGVATNSKRQQTAAKAAIATQPKAEKTELTPFDQALKDFEQMRLKIKKPLTGRAWKLIHNTLAKLAGDDEQLKIAILEQSVVGCYLDVYPLKVANQGRGGYNPAQAKQDQTVNSVNSLLSKLEASDG